MKWTSTSLRRIAAGMACSFCLAIAPLAFADAKSDATIQTKGNCATGASAVMVTNVNASKGLTVIISETTVVSGKTSVNTFDVSLGPNESKPLGCTQQGQAQTQNSGSSWQVQSAQYK